MKRLLLTRHAKSSWDHPELRDLDRPLNKRGLKAAPLMGQVLKQQNLIPDTILISPPKRTRMTADLLAEELKFPLPQIQVIDSFYGASPGEVVHQARKISEEIETAMLVGHNPTWTMLCQRLTGTPLSNLPTCGILVIDFESERWSQFDHQHGTLLTRLFPRDFKQS